jgi:ABC-type dipeptide/oligopeptide/nickel transport system permease component
MGLTLLSGAATLAGILIADVAYAIVDPRIRRG